MHQTGLPAAVLLVVLVSVTAGLSGCSLFVMAGKMFFGDPKIPSPFHAGTGIDLAKDKKKVLLVCSAPEYVKGEHPSIELDLTDGTIRRLRRRGIAVVDPDEVASWIDENGGYWQDPSELAEQFDADIIVHIELSRFSTEEENSPWLFRGRCVGNIYAYEVRKANGKKFAREIFVREFNSVYPETGPLSPDQSSQKAFVKSYLDRVATQITQMLHDHRASELIL